MRAMTLGDMFPELNNCRPEKSTIKKDKNKRQSFGTAARLKNLYPEIEAWDGVLITKMWMHWGDTCDIDLKEPEERDERFVEFLVSFIYRKMLEIESGSKVSKRKVSGIDTAFQGIRQSYLDSEIAEVGSQSHTGGQQNICL